MTGKAVLLVVALVAVVGFTATAVEATVEADIDLLRGSLIENLVQYDRVEEELTLESILERERQTKPSFGISGGNSEDGGAQRSVVQVDGEFVETLSFFFRPDKTYHTIDDYILSLRSSNESVVPNGEADDGEFKILGPEVVEGEVDGVRYYNVTYTITYDQFPGNTVLTAVMEPNPDSTSPIPPTYTDSKEYERTVAGVVIYYLDEDGNPVIVSGADRSYTVDYSDVDQQQDFFVYVQYPDPDKSSSTPGSGGTRDISVGGIAGDYSGQFDFNPDEDCTTGGVWTGTEVDLSDSLEKGCGFSFTSNAPGGVYSGIHFGLLLNKYRSGSTTIDLLLDGFAEDGGSVTQTLNINVQGDPPPVVYFITPDTSFTKFGGEGLTIYYFNSNDDEGQLYRLTDAPLVSDPEFRPILDSYEVFNNFTSKVTVRTNQGEGQDLPWAFTVRDLKGNVAVAVDETQNFGEGPPYLFNYVLDNNQLDSIEPDSGALTNPTGETHVLKGFFSGFDEESGRVVFDNYELPSDLIVWEETNERQIVFIRPEHSDVGAKATYDVSVRVFQTQTNSVPFRYIFQGGFVTIVSSGTTVNQNFGDLELCSCCSARFIAVLSNGAIDQNPRYEWRVDVDEDRNGGYVSYLSLEQGAADPAEFTQAMFVVTGDENNEDDDLRFLNADYRFKVEVTIDIGNGQTQTDEASVVVRKTTLQKIGVQIIKPQTRSPAIPDSEMSVFAIVDIPPCVNDVGPALFTWTLTNPAGVAQEFQFSSRNESIVLDNSTPTRLGQEIKIARKDLFYGENGLNKLSLRATLEQGQFSGYHEISLDVKGSELVSKINGGLTKLKSKLNEGLLLDPSDSFDPDEEYLKKQAPLTVLGPVEYYWTCQSGTSERDISDSCAFFDDVTPATNPVRASEVNIPADVLRAGMEKKMEETGVDVIWVRYRLHLEREVEVETQVDGGKRAYPRKSPTTSIVIEFEKLDADFSSLKSIQLLDISYVARDLTAVPYWEESILTPVFGDEVLGKVIWAHRLVAPTVELPDTSFASRAIKSGMVGFREPNDFVQGDSLPILFKAGDYRDAETGYPLTPGTTYTIELFFSVTGAEGRPYEISFRTLEEPSLIFPPIYVDGFGTVDYTNVLAAFASASFASNRFAFYFYAKNLDRPEGSDNFLCLSTCTGDPYIQFSLALTGTYEIWVRITDVNGQNILAEQVNEVQISVISSISGNDLETIQNRINGFYEIGADGDINTLTTAVATTIRDVAESSPGTGSTTEQEAAERTQFLQNALNMMSQVAHLSKPLPGQNRQLTHTTCTYASLGASSGIIFDDADLYKLVDMFYFAMEQAERTIKYDPDVSTQLVCIFYRLQVLLDEAQERTTTRRRLLQDFDLRRYQEVRLEFFEAFWNVMVRLRIQGRGCGEEGGIGEQGEHAGAFFTPSDRSLLSSTMRVKVVCSTEQKLSEWVVPSGNGYFGGKITICDEAYESLSRSGDRAEAIVVAVGLVPAYMHDAAVQQYLNGILSEGAARVTLYRLNGGVPTEIDLAQLGGCFQLEMDTNSNRDNVLSFDPVMFTNLKEFDVPMAQGGGYNPQQNTIDAESVTMSSDNLTVSFSSSRYGLFGVEYIAGFRSPVNPTPKVSRDPNAGSVPGIGGVAIAGIVIGSLLFLLLLILILFFFFIRLPAAATPLVAAPAAMPIYVDRDVYGRASMFDLEEAEDRSDGDMEELE